MGYWTCFNCKKLLEVIEALTDALESNCDYIKEIYIDAGWDSNRNLLATQDWLELVGQVRDVKTGEATWDSVILMAKETTLDD